MTAASKVLSQFNEAAFGKSERDQKLRAVWQGTHRDYKGTINGQRHILVLRKGGTASVPLTDLTDDEINSRLPRRQA